MAGDELQNDAPHSIKGGKIQQTKSAARLRVSQQSGGSNPCNPYPMYSRVSNNRTVTIKRTLWKT